MICHLKQILFNNKKQENTALEETCHIDLCFPFMQLIRKKKHYA